MARERLAAPGGGSDLPPWGQVLFVIVFGIVAIFVVAHLVKARKRR
jgi:hypothetical protein